MGAAAKSHAAAQRSGARIDIAGAGAARRPLRLLRVLLLFVERKVPGLRGRGALELTDSKIDFRLRLQTRAQLEMGEDCEEGAQIWNSCVDITIV